jgi:hypothetical protein
MASVREQLKAFKELTRKQMQQASARALNKAATSTRAEAARRVKESPLNLKARDIKDQITMERAKAKDGLQRMSAVIRVVRKSVPLYLFGAKERKVKSARGPRVGATVKVKTQRKLVSGGFIARMKSGKVGVWKRTGQTTNKGKERIKQLFSTSVYDVFHNKGFLSDLGAYARARFKVTFAQELKYEQNKTKK